VAGISVGIPLFSEPARQAALAAQIETEAKSGEVTAERKAQLETTSHYLPYMGIVRAFIILPVDAMVTAAIYWALFNIAFNRSAPFRQVLVVVTHSQVIRGIGVLAMLPFALAQPLRPSNIFSLGTLLPIGGGDSRLSRLLENITVFDFWLCGVIAIGLSVVYERSVVTLFVVVFSLFLLLQYLGTLQYQ
jgi:hypothetical protein